MSEVDTSYPTLHGKLKDEFSTNLSGLNNFESLKKALRIINGVEDLQTPDNLSDAEKEKIIENSKGTSDAMARVIQAYIANKLEEVRDELSDDEAVITDILTVTM